MIFSAFGEFEEERGYKSKTNGAGFVRELTGGRTLISGLSQPHSLVPDGDRLVLANSECKEIREYAADGRLVRTAELNGYTRGVCIGQDMLYVGLSCSRNIEDNGAESATVVALDRFTWEECGRLMLPAKEIYAIRQVADSDALALAVGGLIERRTSDALGSRLREAESMIEEARSQAEEARVRLSEMETTLKHIKNSRSWKVTRPARFALRLCRHGLMDEDRCRIINEVRCCYHRLPLPGAFKKAVSFSYHNLLKKSLRVVSRVLRLVVPFEAPLWRPKPQGDSPDYFVWGVIDCIFAISVPSSWLWPWPRLAAGSSTFPRS